MNGNGSTGAAPRRLITIQTAIAPKEQSDERPAAAERGDAIGEPLAERHLRRILRDGIARDWLAMNEPMNDVALDVTEPLELVREVVILSSHEASGRKRQWSMMSCSAAVT